jgi:hypothetical protein
MGHIIHEGHVLEYKNITSAKVTARLTYRCIYLIGTISNNDRNPSS